jgi:hypothetical protein
MTPLHPTVRRIGRFEDRGNPRNKLDGRCNARKRAEGTPMTTINSYMNYAFCALAVISLVGITVAIMISM